jgi:UDP-GlcNAc:undecaprenyl-phosphate GlcNAc-1-phosphate transferase
MTILIVSFVGALVLSLVLNPMYRMLALRMGFVEHPRDGRWHERSTPAVGGLAIFTILLVGAVLLNPLREIWLLLLSVGGIFGIGLIDDLRDLKASTKLIGQIVVASLLLSVGYRLGWTESLILDTLLTLFWIVGITNAFNLLDNMDGLCAGVALIAGAALLAGLVTTVGIVPESFYLAVLLGAIAGFLVFNYHPARVFLGDSGSLLVGLSLSVLPLHLGTGSEPRADVLSIIAAPVMVLLIPIGDTLLVTVSRLLSGRSPAHGGTDHSSHRLVAIGLSPRTAVAVLWTLAAVGGVLGFAIDRFAEEVMAVTGLLFFMAMVIFGVYLSQVRVYEDEDDIQSDRRRLLTPLVIDFPYKRRVAEILLDVGLVLVAYYAAFRLRFGQPVFVGDEFSTLFPSFLASVPLVLGIQVLSLFVTGAYRGVWRHFGLMDVVVLVKGVALGAVTIVFTVTFLYRFEFFSRGVFVIYAALLLLMLFASRASFRLIGEFIQRQRHGGDRLIIYGAGQGGAAAVRELVGQAGEVYRLQGFIDDDPEKSGIRFLGYQVLGSYAELRRLIQRGEVDCVVISTRMIDASRVQELERLCHAYGVRLSALRVELQRLVVGV